MTTSAGRQVWCVVSTPGRWHWSCERRCQLRSCCSVTSWTHRPLSTHLHPCHGTPANCRCLPTHTHTAVFTNTRVASQHEGYHVTVEAIYLVLVFSSGHVLTPSTSSLWRPTQICIDSQSCYQWDRQTDGHPTVT